MIPSLLVVPEVSAMAMAGDGIAFTVIVCVAVAVHPLAFVAVTVYVVVAAGETEIAAVFWPELHTYDVPPEAVSVTAAPLQMIPSLLVVPEVSAMAMAGDGMAFTVIVCVAVAIHPLAFVAVTVYVVVAAGETEIAAVFCPELHTYDVPPEAVSVTAAPIQMIRSLLVVPAVSAMAMTGVG